jgi:hypothetical protein
MTVTVTSIGTNTTQITLTGETSVAGMITAMDNAIVAGGWVRYDVTNQYQRVYRALCKDGSTYKYIGIFIDPGNYKITTTCYESWNATTHVGTNEVYTFNRAGYHGVSLSGCDVIIMVSPFWCVLQTFIRNNPSVWSGVFECAREAPEDTPAAGFPPFVWMCSATAAIGTSATAAQYASFPRTRGGSTGVNAIANGWQTPYVRLGPTTSLDGAALVPMVTYAWDTSKKIIHSLRPIVGTTEIHGRLYGMKATYNAGAPFNRISLPIDTSFNYLSTGTPTEHWILGNTPATLPTTMVTTGTPISGYASGSSSCTLPGNIRSVAFTGTTYYVTHSAGICKIDGTAASLPASATAITGASAVDTHDIVFDGRYIYAATAAGITRLDTTNNDAVTTLALTQGSSALFWDGTNLWAAPRTTIVNNTLYQINVSTFTIANSITLINPVNISIGGMCNDYVGNLYITVNNGTVLKLVIGNTTTTSLITGAFPAANSSNVMFDGANLTVVGMISSVTNHYVGIYTTSGAVVVASSTYFISASASSGSFGFKCPLSRMGLSHISSIATTAAGAYGVGSSNISYAGGSATGFILAGQNGPATNGAYVYSDGARVYGGYNTSFLLVNGLMHPDNGTTIYNRFLLPK